MGRVPKKHRREYTEAVDSDEIDKNNGETKEKETTIAIAEETKGEKEEEVVKDVEKSASGNVNAEHDEDEDDFRSIHDSDGNNDAALDEDVEDGESDNEPLKKIPRTAKTPQNKEKRGESNGSSAKKKVTRKVAKKPAPKKEEEYEVQNIVGHKVERGVDYYLVRWKGYTKNDDTWEPSNTLSCPDLIEKFKKKQSPNTDKLKKKSTSVEKKGPGRGSTKSNAKKLEDPDKQWEVDKIIDYAQEKNGRIFRIRWKGFGPKHDTWEPERNLSCDEVIAKFMQRIKSQEFVSFKELRESPKKPKRLVNETSLRTNYNNAIGRKSKRATTKKRIFYGDSD